MNNAVGRLSHALDASREEQGLCPHVKNPAFDAGLVFFDKERNQEGDTCRKTRLRRRNRSSGIAGHLQKSVEYGSL